MKNIRFYLIFSAIGVIIILMFSGRNFRIYPVSSLALKEEFFFPSESGKIPRMEIQDFKLVQTTGERKQWELSAHEALEYEKEEQIEVRQTDIKFFKEDGKLALTLKAAQGLVDLTSKNIRVAGAVEAFTPDGMKLKTDSLQWLAKEEKLLTDDRVIVVKEGMRIEGRGLEADAGLGIIQVKRDVRVQVLR